jgi:3-oxosteroid 1-dehydrogenase
MDAWDESVEALVVGSGAAGLTAALTAASEGLRTLVVEKAGFWGGTTALSGGGVWIPANPLMQADGPEDTLQAALAYLDSVVEDIGPATSRERRLALLTAGPQMIAMLLEKGVEIEREPNQPDYHAEQPGGRAGRLMQPPITNGRRLGPWLDTLRFTSRSYAVKMNEGAKLARGFSSPSSALGLLRVIVRHHVLKARGWTPLAGGAALATQLMLGLRRADVPVQLSTPLRRVVMENGRTVGVEVEHEGHVRRIQATRGVFLCAGGFARDADFRQTHQGQTGAMSSASPDDTGDAVKLADELGAGTALMDEAWWGPVLLYPGGKPGFTVWERSLPGSMIVDETGRRFTNESQSYDRIGRDMLRLGVKKAWLILDARHRRNYVFGAMPPGQTPKVMFDSGFFIKASGIDALARACRINPAGLEAEIAKFNGFARTGVDEDFHRGEFAYDRHWSDPGNKPNPNLGAIEQPPFLASAIYLGDLGTKGGFVTDADGRVLKPGGEPIEGLYAAGNSTASVMGRGYPGPGVTLGPAMTFAYRAARHAAGCG